LLGKNYALVFTSEDQENGIPLSEMKSAAETGRGIDERWHIRKDGSLFWASGVVEPLRKEDGSLKGFVKILRDFTDKKLAVDALARSQKDLEDFSHIIAHDLQSPLHKIVSFGELLEKSLGKHSIPDVGRYLGHIQSSAVKMRQLISGLLEYSKVTTANKDFELVNLNRGVKDVLLELEVRLSQAHAEVSVDRLPTVYARPLQIQQIFLNLIDNAMKYAGRDKPAVRVTSREEASDWVIGVSDNGPGIPEGDKKRIFDLFQRGEDAEVAGTGIGLTICKKIVERHGGRIWVESETGKGSAFYFTLPSNRRTAERRIEHT